jgi:hypothetical protein
MGKKTEPKKAVAPEKRAAKTQPAAEKITLPEPTAPVAPKARKSTVAAPKPAAKKVTKVVKSAKAKPAYTRDDIALRAYFIAERRQKAGLAGDPHHDWVAAERELAAEAKAAKTKKVT